MKDDFHGKRAVTLEGKREICERIWKAWCKVPALRLGQFLTDAVSSDPYHIEDWDLLEKMEGFASRKEQR